MPRKDLEAAGIPYRDASDRVVDFHALRHVKVASCDVRAYQTLLGAGGAA